jgi:tetratricopeptide (TPR) repeat protein
MSTASARAQFDSEAADRVAGHGATPGQRIRAAAIRFMLLVVLLVLAAAYVLVPRYNERLAMLADAHGAAELIALLEHRRASGDEAPTLLLSLSRAYQAAGNFQQAAADLERYLEQSPTSDIQILARLAGLYEKAQNEPKHQAVLERLVAMTPTLSNASPLSEIYYRQGRFDDARALLSLFPRELTVENGLLLRLAEYHVAAGAKDEAIAVLKRAVIGLRWRRAANNDRERFLLAQLLLETGRSAEAANLGKGWVEEWPDGWRAAKLLRMVAVEAPLADAAVLADAVVAIHPEIRLYLAHELQKLGAHPVSRHLLMTWAAAQDDPTAADLAAFLTACRTLQDPALVWRAFAEVLAARRSEAFIIRFSEAVAAEFGIRALAPFWNALPKTLAQQRPVLAARLMFDAGDIPLTKHFLGKADVSTLEGSDQQFWFDLLVAAAEPRVTLEILRRFRSAGRLPPKLIEQYARLAGSYGQYGEQLAALTEIAAQSGK